MKQKTNHARSKQKRKKLRLKNRMQSVVEKRNAKRLKEYEPKGKTLVGEVKKIVPHVNSILAYKNDTNPNKRISYGFLLDHDFVKRLNQRQKRKRIRQAA